MSESVREVPRLRRILARDRRLRLFAFLPAVLWTYAAVTLVVIQFNKSERYESQRTTLLVYLALAVIASLLASPLIFLRVRSLRRLFVSGERLRARVHATCDSRDCNYLGRTQSFGFPYVYCLEYEALGIEHHRHFSVSLFSRRTRFAAGRELDIFVDSNHPQRYVIPFLFM